MGGVSSVTNAATVAASHPVTVQVINQGPGIWGNVLTGLITGMIAIAGIMLTHHFTLRREKQASEEKLARERHYLATELAFLLEQYASGWKPLIYHQMHNFSRVPDMSLSGVAGDWRALPSRLLFRIRSLEAAHEVLVQTLDRDRIHDIHRRTDLYPLAVGYRRLQCYRVALTALLLAGRLRRLAGVTDSPLMTGSSSTFRQLMKARRLSRKAQLREEAESRTGLKCIMAEADTAEGADTTEEKP